MNTSKNMTDLGFEGVQYTYFISISQRPEIERGERKCSKKQVSYQLSVIPICDLSLPPGNNYAYAGIFDQRLS